MNEKEVIIFLKKARPTLPNGALDRCMASLPEMKKQNRLLPLIKLQIGSIPVSVYVFALLAAGCQISLAINMRPENTLMITGLSGAIVAMLFGWHFMLSFTGDMSEIEKTCKYSYGQILLARVLSTSVITLISLFITIIPNSRISKIGIPFVLATLLPTMAGASVALLYANHMEHSNFIQMTVYLVMALISSLLLEFILELGAIVLLIILLLTSITLDIQIQKQINRRIHYEIYNY